MSHFEQDALDDEPFGHVIGELDEQPADPLLEGQTFEFSTVYIEEPCVTNDQVPVATEATRPGETSVTKSSGTVTFLIRAVARTMTPRAMRTRLTETVGQVINPLG